MPVAELGAQPLDVHGDRGQVAEIPVPHLLEQVFAGEDGAGVGQEEQQQVEFAVRQADRLTPDRHGPRRGADGEIAGRDVDRRTPTADGDRRNTD